jgi:uncharacterized RDD family membrane protein YckC
MEQPDYSIFPERPVIYASFGNRLLALIIDTVILYCVNKLTGILFVKDRSAGWMASAVIGWLYHSLQESGPAMATIGKRALGIKVTNLDGRRISFGQATGRYFAQILSCLILLLGYFMMLWDAKRQTLHDRMAGTLVVRDIPTAF